MSSKGAVTFCIPTRWFGVDLTAKCYGNFQFLSSMISLLHWHCCQHFITLCPPLVPVTHSLLCLLPSLKLFLSLIQGLFHWSLQCCRSLRIYPCCLLCCLVQQISGLHPPPACSRPRAPLLPRYHGSRSSLAWITFSAAPNP